MTIRYRVTGYGLWVTGLWRRGGTGKKVEMVDLVGLWVRRETRWKLEVESWKLDVGLFDECSCQVNKWTDG